MYAQAPPAPAPAAMIRALTLKCRFHGNWFIGRLSDQYAADGTGHMIGTGAKARLRHAHRLLHGESHARRHIARGWDMHAGAQPPVGPANRQERIVLQRVQTRRPMAGVSKHQHVIEQRAVAFLTPSSVTRKSCRCWKYWSMNQETLT